MQTRLYVVALRCMNLICQNKALLNQVCDSYANDGLSFFHEMIKKSLSLCYVQRGYSSSELEVSEMFYLSRGIFRYSFLSELKYYMKMKIFDWNHYAFIDCRF